MTGACVNIDPRLQALLDNSPGPWGCKDRNSIFLYVNQAYGQLVGVPRYLELIGKREDELPCGAAECADMYRQQDLEVMETGLPLRILDIHPYANDHWRAFIFIKTPLLDAEHNMIGTLFYGSDASAPLSRPLMQLVNMLALYGPELDLSRSTHYALANVKLELSRSEAEVLFYLLHSKTQAEIARTLDLSDFSLEQQLELLKKKFGAASQADLIDKALRLGYSCLIPNSLFDRQLSTILREPETSHV